MSYNATADPVQVTLTAHDRGLPEVLGVQIFREGDNAHVLQSQIHMIDQLWWLDKDIRHLARITLDDYDLPYYDD